ncbi:MAG: superoxide dismutase family protein [Alphaproteobacteria bacterium]|nr:superoxide dismutase family protein [Alphaproteobacteria bacterium]
MKRMLAALALGVMLAPQSAPAATVFVTMYEVNQGGVGDIVGFLNFQDTVNGLRIVPNLRGLSEGQHGTHVHQNPDCGVAEKGDGTIVPGGAAGSHFDPQQTGAHLGPNRDGHLGDLPVLYVGADGTASRVMRAPRLTTADLVGRAIVIHSGGDNYSDIPKPLGGGGSRVACGVVGQ